MSSAAEMMTIPESVSGGAFERTRLASDFSPDGGAELSGVGLEKSSRIAPESIKSEE